MIIVSDDASPEVLNPGKKTLNFPAPAITPQFSSVLCLLLRPVASVWGNQFNFSFLQGPVERITVIGQVTNDAFRFFFHMPCVNSFFNQFHFMCVGPAGPYGDRNTMSVCHGHDLGALASLSFSNTSPPFLALAKVPSIKHSVMSILPRFFKSLANRYSILSHTPDRFRSWKYRWQVWKGGYRSGISGHGAPVRHTHNMPLTTERRSARGLPLLPADFFGYLASRISFINSHCSSFRSMFFLQNSAEQTHIEPACISNY